MRRNQGYTLIEIMFGSAIFIIICAGFYNFFAWTFRRVGPQLSEIYCWSDAKELSVRIRQEMTDVIRILAPTESSPVSDYLAVQKASGHVVVYLVDPLKGLWKKQLTGNLPPEELRPGSWPYHIMAKPVVSEEWVKPEVTAGQFYFINPSHVTLYMSLAPIAKSSLIHEPIQILTSLSIP